MDNNNVTNDANVQANAQPTVDANVQQNVTTDATPAQPVQPTKPSAQYSMPVARAGQLLATPAKVKAILQRASSRVITDPSGNSQEFIILEFEGFPTAIVRTMAQAKGDLIEQYNKEQLNAMNTTLASASYNRFFKNKSVELTASYHEVGAIHTVDENSALFKSGTQQLGAQVPTTSEGIWVEGFIRVEQTAEELDAIIARELKAIADASKANSALVF